MKEKEKQVASREAAVSRKEREQAAKDEAQKEKDEAQAAKDKELAKRPPRTVTRTVTPVAKFAGFSVTETVNLGHLTKEVAKGKTVYNALRGSKRQGYLTRAGDTKVPNVIPGIQDGEVIYKFDFHNLGALSSANSYSRYFGNTLTAYPKIFTFNQNSYTATALELGLGEKFNASILVTEIDTSGSNGANNAKIHAEVVTDYSSDNTTDWLTWGHWVQVPKDTLNLDDYKLGTFAMSGATYGAVPSQLTGTVTYKGGLLGLHTSLENGEVKLSRFSGKATLTANFSDASSVGNMNYLFNEFKLDGKSVSGQFTRNSPFDLIGGGPNIGVRFFSIGGGSQTSLDDNNYSGIGYVVLTGPKPNNTTQPTGYIGTLRGSTSDGTKHFAASFGAKKTE